ncbi:molybdopterin converting factor subunit 1 [Niveibacterium sp. SC-1]|uniref:molybdopterin converting factor subunit 1 n=1 Tax=Niveibacterium sp. SC-1 TaxID=3135646 RepID=UPI0031201681
MSVRVLFFAGLREALGAGETVALEAGDSVGALRKRLAARGGAWVALEAGRNVRAAVNQEMVPADHVLADGDELAFFPPVTGG